MSRPPLTRDRILTAAIGLADAGGLDALSMRRLAQELGVEAMSLYHYVRSKDELHDGMVDLVLAEIVYPPEGEHWKAALRRVAVSYRKALARHPWAPPLMFARASAVPARISPRYMETMLRTLSEAGFSAELTDLAYHSLDSHIIGFTLWAANIAAIARKGRLEELAAGFLSSVASGEYPHLVKHVHHHLAPPAQPRSAFEFGLDLILDGLERLREEPSQAREATPARITRRPRARRARAQRPTARR